MINRFMEGHYYIYHGEERGNGWNTDGYMDYVLDGKPHLCIKTGHFPYEANFKDDFNGAPLWQWNNKDMKLFEDVTMEVTGYDLSSI